MTSSPTRLKAVVVGAGTGGNLSINALLTSSRYELAGVADTSAASLRRFSQAVGQAIRTDMDYGALVDAVGPDVICISTYAPSHAEITQTAIEKGARGLLVEKPLGDTAAAGRRILDITQSAKIPLVVPHGLMALAAPLDIIRRVHSGEIGRLVLVEMESAQWDIINAGIHWLQFCSALTAPAGVATVLTACDSTSRTFRDGMQVETDSITIATTTSGVRLVLQTGDYIELSRPGTKCVMRIIGTDGMIEYGPWDDHFTLITAGHEKQEVKPEPLPVAGHQYHLEHLADLVEGGALDYGIPLTSLTALETVEAAYLSNRTRRQVTLPVTEEMDEPLLSAGDWDPGRPYTGVGGGRNGREL